MKVNYDFYTGQDNYCDGDVEKDVIEYTEKYSEKDFDKIFEYDVRWPVFYHLTSLRKNIINWYPFKEDAEVLEIGAGMGAITGILCEKAKKVTAVELSKQRATSIMNRCKDKENLEIILGNFNEIKFNKKFDYITLIGVLEYAPLYTNTENPFYDFLTYIKSLLKEDGKLLIAIENQFGLKYFSGANEDHTGKKYDGILGYTNKKGIRTFGKKELTEILKSAGYNYLKYYYPMPDYKLPNYIFSDEYLPNEETIEEYTPYLSDEKADVEYNEKEAYKDIIKNGQFDFFANSFFIETSLKEIDTKIDLSKQKLVKVTDTMRKFYDKHYKIKNEEDKTVINQLTEENQKLKEELNLMANSKSWKITKPIRDFRTKNK